MHHKGLSREFLRGYSGKVGKPVVGMDDVELVLHRDSPAHLGITGHLLEQVGAVFSGELELLSEAHRGLVHMLLLHLLDRLVVFRRVYIGDKAGVHVDELDLIYELLNAVADIVHRDVAGIDYPGAALVFVAGSRGHHEEHLDTVMGQAPDDTFAGRTESACNVRRELPTEHQDSHFSLLLYLSNILSTESSEAVLSADEIAPWGACGGSPS